MSLFSEIRRRAPSLVGPFLGACAVVYFAYHTVQGDRGLLAWWRLRHEISEAQLTLARVKGQRDALERRAGLLRPDSLDPDMLEERARVMLHVGRDDEAVILLPKGY